jgi:hypothetical protein
MGVAIQNLGAADIYVGGDDVSTSNGIKVASNGGEYAVDTQADDVLYAVSGSAGNDVRVMLTKAPA